MSGYPHSLLLDKSQELHPDLPDVRYKKSAKLSADIKMINYKICFVIPEQIRLVLIYVLILISLENCL